MALLDLLGHRWTLRVLWELRGERMTFRALRDACEQVSPTVLNQRLRELRDARLVEQSDEAGYGLTTMGEELLDRIVPISEWAARWSKAF
jgi:DNA-binding HxlR family transcriptional regulator